MIQFVWKGAETTATLENGQWVHGLPEVVEMLQAIAPPADKNALSVAADRLGGTVVTEPPTSQEN